MTDFEKDLKLCEAVERYEVETLRDSEGHLVMRLWDRCDCLSYTDQIYTKTGEYLKTEYCDLPEEPEEDENKPLDKPLIL